MTPEEKISPARRRGRPPSFNRAEALKAAQKLFWDRGYEGTSFDELITAMGISASSFYNSFGSKEALYEAAIEAYMAEAAEWFQTALRGEEGTRAAFLRLLQAAAAAFTRRDHPSGCMISAAETQCAPGHERVRDLLASVRTQAEGAMAERLQAGLAAGDLPAETDVATLSAYFDSLLRGMAVQARDGASTEKLMNIALTGMRAWPGEG